MSSGTWSYLIKATIELIPIQILRLLFFIKIEVMLKKVVLGILVVAAFAGCLKEGTNTSTFTCTYDSCAVKAPDAEIQRVKAYVDSAGINATQHCSGVFYVIDTLGTGKTPTACSDVAVTYKGTLTNGTVFDQNTTGVAFNLGSLIRSWRNTIPLIREGGKMRLYVPPTLGYGSQANGPIPANSILIFEIKLLATQ